MPARCTEPRGDGRFDAVAGVGVRVEIEVDRAAPRSRPRDSGGWAGGGRQASPVDLDIRARVAHAEQWAEEELVPVPRVPVARAAGARSVQVDVIDVPSCL